MIIKQLKARRQRKLKLKENLLKANTVSDSFLKVSYSIIDLHGELFSSTYDYRKTFSMTHLISMIQDYASSFPTIAYHTNNYDNFIRMESKIKSEILTIKKKMIVFIEDEVMPLSIQEDLDSAEFEAIIFISSLSRNEEI